MYRLPEPERELLKQWFIQPQLVLEGRDRLRRGFLAQQHPRWITGNQVDQHKGEKADEQSHWQHKEHALDNITNHPCPRTFSQLCAA